MSKQHNGKSVKFASVLLSTFEQPNALRISLLGYLRQTTRQFEIIVADDGSDERTSAVINEMKQSLPVRIEHVWQENRGYRRAKIVNKAFMLSSGNVIILSDGDCIPRANFVETHLRYCNDNTYCVGGYIRLSDEFSAKLSATQVTSGDIDRIVTTRDKWRFTLTHFKSLFYALIKKSNRPKIYGCNISVGRRLFESVNGYDENFDGFGKEDSDLRNRMNLHGAVPISVWSKTWVYHIADTLDPGIKARRIPRDKAKARQYYYRENVTARCANGIVKEQQ